MDNPVGAEYILMEEACGKSLRDLWEDMGIHSKDSIVKDIVSIEQKLLSVSFSRLDPRIRLGKLLTPLDMAIYTLQKILSQGARKQRLLAIFRKN